MIAITGFGVVSPLGVGRDANAEGLRSGRSGIGTVTRFDASAYRSAAAAEVPDAWLGGAVWPGGSPVDARYGRAARYAGLALAEALQHAGLAREDLRDAGLVFGGSTAGTPEAEAPLIDRGAADYFRDVPRAVFLSSPVGHTAEIIAARGRFGGPVTTISTACSSATNAIGLALDWLRSGRVDRVIAGGADAHCRLTHAGFNALGLVAPDAPRPFDARRQGMVIGEGAAFFVLERAADAAARGARVSGWVLGFGTIAEGHHIVQPQPDGDGAARAMAAALADAGLPADAVDYINAHGTATDANDRAEARGVCRVFGGRALPVSSTKSQVGHLLGASGAVELASVLLAMRGGFLPPTIGWAEPDPEIDLDVVPGASRPGAIGVALSNSFAFGGNDSTLCVAHPDWSRP